MLPFHITIQIGKRLQTVRENSGYTQEAFAEALDIGVEHYRKIELGMGYCACGSINGEFLLAGIKEGDKYVKKRRKK